MNEDFKQKNNYTDYLRMCMKCIHSEETPETMTGTKCLKGNMEVSPEGSCDLFVDRNPAINS